MEQVANRNSGGYTFIELLVVSAIIIIMAAAAMPLAKVTDMSFQRSAMGRLLGYGEFIVESAGQNQALRIMDHLPYPEQLYLEVCGLIFKDNEEGAD